MKKIAYKCTSCNGYMEVDEDKHEDPNIYFECDCGEQMLPDPEKCDHDYQWEDTSFDHEYGTESSGFWECQHCQHNPEDLPPPEPEFFGDEAI